MPTKKTCEIWLIVDGGGNYEVGADLSAAEDLFYDNVGGSGPRRVVRPNTGLSSKTFPAKKIGRKTFCLATATYLGRLFEVTHRRRGLMARICAVARSWTGRRGGRGCWAISTPGILLTNTLPKVGLPCSPLRAGSVPPSQLERASRSLCVELRATCPNVSDAGPCGLFVSH
jgi:hypothetical protein